MNPKDKPVQSTKELLSKIDFIARLTEQNKYIFSEHQDYGLRLAQRMGDLSHKTLYILLAKEIPRNLLDAAVSFASDYPEKGKDGNKGRIFMWKLKQLCSEKNVKIPVRMRRTSKKKQYLKKQIKLI